MSRPILMKLALLVVLTLTLPLSCKSTAPPPDDAPTERGRAAWFNLWTAMPPDAEERVTAGESILTANGDLAWTGHTTGPFGTTFGGNVPEKDALAFDRDDTHHLALVARLEQPGKARWIRAIPNPQRKIPPRIAGGPDGRIYVALNTRNYAPPMRLEDVPTRQSDRPTLRPMLHALTPEGDTRWSMTLAPRADTVSQFDVRALDVAPNGDLFLAATFSRTTRFMDAIDLTSNGGRDVLLARLTADGQIRWTRTFGGSGDEQLNDLVAMPDGGFFAAGFVSSRFQSGTIQSTTRRKSVFYARFDANGEEGITRVSTDARRESWVEDLAVDTKGRIAVLGTATSGPDMGNGPLLESKAEYRTFVTLLDTDGIPVWAHGFEGDWNQAGAVAFGPSGELVVGLTLPGNQSGPEPKTIDIGGGKIGNSDGIDGLIFHMDVDDGAVQRTIRLDSKGTPGGVGINGLHLTPDGSMVAFGDFLGEATFGGNGASKTPVFIDDPCASSRINPGAVRFAKAPYDPCLVDQRVASAVFFSRWYE